MMLARTTWGIWIVLFFLFLPFPYSLLPNFGETLSELLFPVVKSFGSLFGQELTQTNFHSDSIHLYLQLLTTLVLSVLISSILFQIKSLNKDKLKIILHAAASYILAFFLIKYGCDKLFKYQFYDGAPNTLFTPVGYLSKDILFWTSMGSSHSYNVFMGLIEIIPGLLLLWSRTRMLGALISLGVLTNVLALNFGFDITVKILSSMLVVTSLFVLEKDGKRLWQFFVQSSFVKSETHSTIIKKPKIKRGIKGLIVSLMIIESLFTYISTEAWNADNLPKIKYYGSYELSEQLGTSTAFEIDNIRRIHIHNSGYLITENHNGQFSDYKISVSPLVNEIKIPKLGIVLNIVDDKNSFSFISGTPRNQFRLVTKKIDLKTLPYHFDSFHWTVESFATD